MIQMPTLKKELGHYEAFKSVVMEFPAFGYDGREFGFLDEIENKY